MPQPSRLLDRNLIKGLVIQYHVIGALIIRELHTRFGRDNIGFLWLIAEPMLFTVAVTAIHVGSGAFVGYEMPSACFWIVGYTPYILFRSVVGRAESTIEANKSLLYHRVITILDLLLARALLEGISVLVAIVILVCGATLLGLGFLPQRPLLLLAGMGLMLWFTFGLSLLICAYGERYPVVGRLVHPAVYLSLPVSGAFFAMNWMPQPLRDYLTWVPLTSIFEMIREGQFAIFNSHYIYPGYVIGWCLVMTFLGLISIYSLRQELHLE